MAIAVRGTGAAAGSASATSGASISATPALPTSSASNDRVYIYATGTGPITTPTNWTAALASTSLGSGTMASTTGPRECAVFYRDYDGAWTMPSVTAAGVTSVPPSIEVASIAYSCGAGEEFDTPAVGTGSDTTSGTGYSVTTGSFADPTGGILWMLWSWPATPGTLSALSLTASGVTFGANTSRHGVNGQAGSAFNTFLATWTYPVTTGATAAHTGALTGTNARTAGMALVAQTASVPPSAPLPPRIVVSNPAALRAATR